MFGVATIDGCDYLCRGEQPLLSADELLIPGSHNRANALAALSADISGLFPEGSDFGETRAKEEIWSDRAAFDKAADDAKTATAAFAAAVAAGDKERIGASYRDVGESCKACHNFSTSLAVLRGGDILASEPLDFNSSSTSVR